MRFCFEQIEDVILDDAGSRGLIPFALRGELDKVIPSLLTANHTLIVTGFYIEKTKSGETDGPLGSIFLARALQSIGIRVSFVTSPYNAKILTKTVESQGMDADVIVVGKGEEIDIFPKLLSDQNLTHMIAVEQMGAAIDGKYYNMTGKDLSYSTAHFDSLFILAREKGIITIGIGDGGNEIGMGNLFYSLHRKIQYDWISCITPVDYLIVAGTSNWGAYGLIAGLACITRQSLLHDVHQEKELLKEVLRLGAVDGITLEPSLSVDGLPLTKHREILEKLENIIKGAVIINSERRENSGIVT
jgi:hypothetical protein